MWWRRSTPTCSRRCTRASSLCWPARGGGPTWRWDRRIPVCRSRCAAGRVGCDLHESRISTDGEFSQYAAEPLRTPVVRRGEHRAHTGLTDADKGLPDELRSRVEPIRRDTSLQPRASYLSRGRDLLTSPMAHPRVDDGLDIALAEQRDPVGPRSVHHGTQHRGESRNQHRSRVTRSGAGSQCRAELRQHPLLLLVQQCAKELRLALEAVVHNRLGDARGVRHRVHRGSLVTAFEKQLQRDAENLWSAPFGAEVGGARPTGASGRGGACRHLPTTVASYRIGMQRATKRPSDDAHRARPHRLDALGSSSWCTGTGV